jgi:hypothetical protein
MVENIRPSNVRFSPLFLDFFVLFFNNKLFFCFTPPLKKQMKVEILQWDLRLLRCMYIVADF